MGCETYCLKDQRCWGCSVQCYTPDKCQYNAIANCGELQNWAGLIKGDVTQKPGKLQYIFYLTPVAAKINFKSGFTANKYSYHSKQFVWISTCQRDTKHIN